MKKLLIGILLCSMYLLTAEGTDPTGTTIINTSRYLSYFGFTGGKYNAQASIVSDAEFEDTNNFTSIEGNKNSLDTPEEFITAAYFSPVQIQVTDVSLKASIEADLPHGPDGKPTNEAGLKLAVMWMMKRARNLAESKNDDGFGVIDIPNYDKSYLHAIDTIKEKTGISDQEINAYYTMAIENESVRIAHLPVVFSREVQTVLENKPLSTYYTDDQLKKAIFRPLIKYLIAPTKANEDAITSVAYYFQDKESSERKSYIMPYYFVIGQFSSVFCIYASTIMSVYKELPPYLDQWTPEMEAAKQ